MADTEDEALPFGDIADAHFKNRCLYCCCFLCGYLCLRIFV